MLSLKAPAPIVFNPVFSWKLIELILLHPWNALPGNEVILVFLKTKSYVPNLVSFFNLFVAYNVSSPAIKYFWLIKSSTEIVEPSSFIKQSYWAYSYTAYNLYVVVFLGIISSSLLK